MMHQANGACGMTLSPGSPDTARPFDVVSVSMDMGLSLCLGQKCCSALPAPVHPLPRASPTPRSFLAIGILTPCTASHTWAHGERRIGDGEYSLPPWGLCSNDSAVLPWGLLPRNPPP